MLWQSKRRAVPRKKTRDNDNEIKDSADGLGGSAPCDITFEAIVTDAAIFREWQISRSPEFDITENTYSELRLITHSARTALGMCVL